jgi:Uma2 family endonuclease
LEKDTEEKRVVYAQAGILNYWVVNLRDRTLIIYRHPLGGDYQPQEEQTSGNISPLTFPDIVMNINTILS